MDGNGSGSTNPDVPPPKPSTPKDKDSTADMTNSPVDEPAIKKSRLDKPGPECIVDTKTDIVVDEREVSNGREVRNENMTTPLSTEIPPDMAVSVTSVEPKNEDAKRKKAQPNGGSQSVAQPPAEQLPNDQLETSSRNQSKLIDEFQHVAPSTEDDLQRTLNVDLAASNMRQPVNLDHKVMDDIPCRSQQANEPDMIVAKFIDAVRSLVRDKGKTLDEEQLAIVRSFLKYLRPWNRLNPMSTEEILQEFQEMMTWIEKDYLTGTNQRESQNVAQPPAEQLPNDQLETSSRNQSKLIDEFQHVAPSTEDDLQRTSNVDSAASNMRQPVNLDHKVIDDIPCRSQQANEPDMIVAKFIDAVRSLVRDKGTTLDEKQLAKVRSFVKYLRPWNRLNPMSTEEILQEFQEMMTWIEKDYLTGTNQRESQNVAQPPAEQLPNDQLETSSRNQSKLIDEFQHVAPSTEDDLQRTSNVDSAASNMRQPVNLDHKVVDDIPCRSQQHNDPDTLRVKFIDAVRSLIRNKGRTCDEENLGKVGSYLKYLGTWKRLKCMSIEQIVQEFVEMLEWIGDDYATGTKQSSGEDQKFVNKNYTVDQTWFNLYLGRAPNESDKKESLRVKCSATL